MSHAVSFTHHATRHATKGIFKTQVKQTTNQLVSRNIIMIWIWNLAQVFTCLNCSTVCTVTAWNWNWFIWDYTSWIYTKLLSLYGSGWKYIVSKTIIYPIQNVNNVFLYSEASWNSISNTIHHYGLFWIDSWHINVEKSKWGEYLHIRNLRNISW